MRGIDRSFAITDKKQLTKLLKMGQDNISPERKERWDDLGAK